MTAPAIQETEQEKIQHNIKAYQAAIAAGTHTQQDLDDYLSEVHEARTGKPFVKPAADVAEPVHGTLDKVLGVVASTGRDIPGVEFAQAGARSLFRGQPYREALSDIRGAEDAAPALATGAARVGGGVLAGMAMPGGLARQGFLGGAAHALGNADPDVNLKSRIDRAGIEGAVGGAIGGALQGAGVLRNVVKNAPPGAVGKTVREIPGVPKIQRIIKAWQPAKVAAGDAASAAKPSEFDTLVDELQKVTGVPREKAMAVIRANRPDLAGGEVAGTITPASVSPHAPKAEGLLSNGMDNMLEAAKAREGEVVGHIAPETDPVNQKLFDLLSREAQAADEASQNLPNVVKATQRYRTESGRLQQGAPQARFDWFADRMKKQP